MKTGILIVDDDAGTRVNIAAGLRKCGYESISASSRAEALEVLHTARSQGYSIDLAIVDIELPGMSGKELVAEMKKIEPPVAVFIVSGFIDKIFIIDLLNRKESSFITATIDTQRDIRQQEKRWREHGSSTDAGNNRGGVV